MQSTTDRPFPPPNRTSGASRYSSSRRSARRRPIRSASYAISLSDTHRASGTPSIRVRDQLRLLGRDCSGLHGVGRQSVNPKRLTRRTPRPPMRRRGAQHGQQLRFSGERRGSGSERAGYLRDRDGGGAEAERGTRLLDHKVAIPTPTAPGSGRRHSKDPARLVPGPCRSALADPTLPTR